MGELCCIHDIFLDPNSEFSGQKRVGGVFLSLWLKGGN